MGGSFSFVSKRQNMNDFYFASIPYTPIVPTKKRIILVEAAYFTTGDKICKNRGVDSQVNVNE